MPTDALLTQAIPSLIGGVSQQPTNQRLTSQAEVQDNVVSDVAAGAVVRPPTEHIALLTGSAAGGSPTGGFKMHAINRGNGQQFEVILEDGDINVYDLSDGSEVTVNDNAAGTEGSYTYLDFDTASYTAEQAFSLVTVADYTFVTNKTVTTAMSGVASASRTNAHEFIVHIKSVASVGGQNIVKLTFGATTISPGASAANTSDAIMDALCTALTGGANPSDTTGTGGGSSNDFKFTRLDTNTLHGYQFQNPNVLVTSHDKFADTLHRFITTGPNGEEPQVARFSDLPETAVDGFSVKVKGDDGNNEDDFYVTYSEDDSIWKESTVPGLDNAFDEDTMPHALVYNEGTGQFSFEPVTWADRPVGDSVSAPEPSFVGAPVNDIVLHKNRLILISDENAIASESGEFFNFWPTTVTTLVDSDPWDVAGTGDTVAIWDHAIPYRSGLALFSSTGNKVAEIVGSRDEPLTVKNARIEERGTYAQSDIRPVAAGPSVYFVNDRGGSTAVSSFAELDVELFRADEVTSHVPLYVPTNIVRMSASPSESMVTLLSSNTDEDHRVYVYRFHTIGDNQVMASWFRWHFADNDVVLSVDWIESVLYLLIERQDGVHLEKIDFGKSDEDEGAFAANLGYRVHLDSLLSLTGVYDAPSDTTTWTIPYDQATNGGTYQIVKGGAWGSERGSVIPILNQAVDLVITATGDHSAQAVYIGRLFDWSYELSQIHLRSRDGTVDRGRLVGRLQLRKGQVVYKDTGTFDVEIRSREDSEVFTETFTSQFLNQAIFGPTGLDDGVFDFDIGGDSRNVRVIFTGESFLPAQLSAVEWEGRYVQRAEQA